MRSPFGTDLGPFGLHLGLGWPAASQGGGALLEMTLEAVIQGGGGTVCRHVAV
jgi:hypothetical protein